MKHYLLSLALIGIALFPSQACLAEDSILNTSDMIVVQKWLSKNGGTHWKLLYNEQGERKYRWNITKIDKGHELWVHFHSGEEIDENGSIIGAPARLSDQFFTIIIDKETYKLKNVLLGG